MFIETSLPRTSWIRKENINVMCIRNRFPIRKFFPTIKSYRLKEMTGNLRQPLIDGGLNITCFPSIGFQCDDGFSAIKSDRLNSLLYHNHSLNCLAFIHIFIGLINIFQFITCGKDTTWIDVAIKNSF